MKPRARTEKQADDAAGFEQGTIGRVTLSMGVAVAIVKLRIRSPCGKRQVSHKPLWPSVLRP